MKASDEQRWRIVFACAQRHIYLVRDWREQIPVGSRDGVPMSSRGKLPKLGDAGTRNPSRTSCAETYARDCSVPYKQETVAKLWSIR